MGCRFPRRCIAEGLSEVRLIPVDLSGELQLRSIGFPTLSNFASAQSYVQTNKQKDFDFSEVVLRESFFSTRFVKALQRYQL